MGLIILAAFIAVPLIEIGLFIQVGEQIGLWPTIFVVVITAVIGTALLRHQGLSALHRLQTAMDAGQPPLGPVFDGFCLLAAGALLLTPGFFTDAIGFLLFTPPLRAALRGFLGRRIQVQGASTSAHFHHSRTTHGGTRPNGPGHVIDGDWQDVTPTDTPTDPAKTLDSQADKAD